MTPAQVKTLRVMLSEEEDWCLSSLDAQREGAPGLESGIEESRARCAVLRAALDEHELLAELIAFVKLVPGPVHVLCHPHPSTTLCMGCAQEAILARLHPAQEPKPEGGER